MAERIQKETPAPQKEETTTTPVAKDIKNEELDASTEALMDEIDEILEKDAEEFVKAYVQRGGE